MQALRKVQLRAPTRPLRSPCGRRSLRTLAAMSPDQAVLDRVRGALWGAARGAQRAQRAAEPHTASQRRPPSAPPAARLSRAQRGGHRPARAAMLPRARRRRQPAVRCGAALGHRPAERTQTAPPTAQASSSRMLCPCQCTGTTTSACSSARMPRAQPHPRAGGSGQQRSGAGAGGRHTPPHAWRPPWNPGSSPPLTVVPQSRPTSAQPSRTTPPTAHQPLAHLHPRPRPLPLPPPTPPPAQARLWLHPRLPGAKGAPPRQHHEPVKHRRPWARRAAGAHHRRRCAPGRGAGVGRRASGLPRAARCCARAAPGARASRAAANPAAPHAAAAPQ